MENLPVYYTILCNAVTEAIEAIERHDCEAARVLLIGGQLRAEEAYIEAGETPPPNGP